MDTKDTKDVKTPGINFLKGPISLTHHVSTLYNKNVYVFGEDHQTDRICNNNKTAVLPHIFFDKVLKDNPDKVIDVFIEQPYNEDKVDINTDEFKTAEVQRLQKEKDDNNSMWNEVFGMPIDHKVITINDIPDRALVGRTSYFMPCFIKLKIGQCPYKNKRIHLTDVRQDIGYGFSFWLFMLGKELEKFLDEGVYDIDRNNKTKIKDDFHGTVGMLTHEGKGKEMCACGITCKSAHGVMAKCKDYRKTSRIDKNLNMIKDRSVAIKIFKYFNSAIESLGLTTKLLYQMLEYFDFIVDNYNASTDISGTESITDKVLLQQLSNADAKLKLISRVIAKYGVLLVDYYTITRMFREFKPKTQGQYSESPKDIMIYVGDAHARNYREFFKYMEFTETESTYAHLAELGTECVAFGVPNIGNNLPLPELYSCLDITKIKQPLFS